MSHLFSNRVPRNKTTQWFPSDTKELWKKNLKKHPDKIQKLGWTEDSIEYCFDSLGFRNDTDFDAKKDYNLVLGCSHTFGIGVRNEHVWFNYLTDKFNEPFYNAAIPGGSIGGCVRSLLGLQQKGMKIRRVFVLLPDRTRYEVYDNSTGAWEVVSWWTNHPKDLTKFLLDEISLTMFYETNKLALQQLCYANDIELIDLPVDAGDDIDIRICGDLQGRDLMHSGIKTQKWIGEKFYDEYCKRYRSST